MGRFVHVAAAWVAVAGWALLSAGAGAEAFVDVRFGGVFTDDGDFNFSGGGMSLSGTTQFDDSATGGLRGGYWFRGLPWLGVAGDVSYFAPDEDSPLGVDIHVIPITPLLMLRLPLFASDAAPEGRVQPYGAIGPGIFVTVIEEDTTDFTAVGVDVGLDARAGLNVQILHWLAVFAEYRYTSYEASVEDDILGIDIDTDVDLDSHHITGGVGFHF